ncbi:MAG: glycine oxidase [Oleispira sp.]|jgi:glycine oxidase
MSLNTPKKNQVIIVGAGVAGLCVASELLDKGIITTVIDRQSEPGPQSCSWWAGGMLAPFCESESAESSVVKFGQISASWWQEKTGLVTQNGSLVVASRRDMSDLQRFAKLTKEHVTLNQQQIAELEPDLSANFVSGLYYQSEAHLAPRQALKKLRENLLYKGVQFLIQNADLNKLAKQHLVIDCRGIEAKASTEGLRGVKGEMLILRCPDINLQRPIRLLHPRIPLYIVPRGDNVYMIGATMIESSAKTHASVRSVMELLNAAYALNPSFGEAEILEIGVNSRPAFNDNLPKVRRRGNVITANGLYRHGFLLAPTLAKMVAEYLVEEVEPEWFESSLPN